MAKPEKDQVLDASASETNPGAGSPNPPSSEPGASAPVAADPHGPAAASGGAPGADAPMGEAVEAEVIEPADIDIDADALDVYKRQLPTSGRSTCWCSRPSSPSSCCSRSSATC